MNATLDTGWRVPEGLHARAPAEQRGSARDDVRLMVSSGGPGAPWASATVEHRAFRDLPRLLRAGDVLAVNTSPTLPAAVDGRLGAGAAGTPLVVHFSTRGDDGRWAVELRRPDGRGTTEPWPGGSPAAGSVVRLRGGESLVLEEPVGGGGAGGTGGADSGEDAGGKDRAADARLRWARISADDVPAHLHRYGRPIRYPYTERDQPLAAHQTVFAAPTPDGAGSAEMPSASRPFTTTLVAELVSRGIQFAPVVLHTGVSSPEAHEPPYPERFAVPEPTARLINAARAGGGRLLAIGTTAVRALESAATERGTVRAADGWTDLVVTPERGVRAVDGLLTGLHEPEASHLLMLQAVAGFELLCRSYEEALRERYLWHEFGDSHLILRAGA